jgi:hypothetical protein
MPEYIIERLDFDNRRQVKAYLELPFRLYKDTPQWVPPLSFEVRQPFNRRRFAFYRHGEAAFFLVNDQHGQAVGRIAVINNHNHNRYNQEKTAFFYHFECIDDEQAASLLFDAVVGYARQQGLNRLFGPKGFTVFDGLGLLAKGFEHRPAFGQPYNFPYYERLVTTAGGLGDASDLLTGYMDASSEFPERIHELAERIQQRRGLKVTRFSSRHELRSLVPYLKELYNNSLTGTSGNTPLTDDDARSMAEQLIWFADPRLIKIVMKGGQAVGFLFAYPDITAAIQRTRGRLFPFGWIDLLLELRRTRWVNVNGAGMAEGYRGVGGTALLFSELYKSVAGSGYLYGDLIQIGAENERMLRDLENIGITFHKLHRVYSRDL